MNGDLLLGVAAGLGLAAACGFRVFVPLLAMSLAARMGHFEPSAGFAWLATTPALLAFAVATAVEIAAAHVPWLDHVLDVAAAPLAVAAGAVAMAAALGQTSPFLRWTLAVIAGGGAAGAFHALNGIARTASTLTTAGLGNPLFASVETAGAASLAAGALLLPALGLVLAGVLLFAALRLAAPRRR